MICRRITGIRGILKMKLITNQKQAVAFKLPCCLLLQVLRVWGPKGDCVAARRGAAGTLAPTRLSAFSSMAWHPYQLLFAAGGTDSTMAIFEIEMDTHTAASAQSP